MNGIDSRINLVSYGQHYLEDSFVIEEFIKTAKLSKQDVVLEIGAGDGRITKILAKKVRKVISYEIDLRTKDLLMQLQNDFDNIDIHFESFLERNEQGFENKIVASLPYQITEPFIERIIHWNLSSITLIVGKTFADNAISLSPDNKLSILTQCYFSANVIRYVKRECFSPPPKTTSAVICLVPIEKSKLIEKSEYFLMREIFEQRDKKPINALREALIRLWQQRGLNLTKRESKSIIQQIQTNNPNISLNKPIEQMNNTEIVSLFKELKGL